MSLTSSIYDHFIIWPSSVTLTFNLSKQMFWTALLRLKDNNCAKLFWNPCINVQVMAQTSSIYDHFYLYLTPMTLTFNLREKMFQMALLLLKENNCAKLFLKSMHKCTSYGPEKLNIWPFWPLFDPFTLTFHLPKKCFNWHFSSPRTTTVQNYFWNPWINVQVMVWTSSIYDHFDLYLTPMTLTFILPEKLFQMALLLLKGNNCAKSFWNPCINVQVYMLRQAQYMYLTILTFIWPLWPWPSTYLKKFSNGISPPQGQQLCQIVLKSMHYCTSYGLDKFGRTHGRTDARTYTELKL